MSIFEPKLDGLDLEATLDHGVPIRAAAGVSEEAMNRVYETLREMSPEHLGRMWERADPWTPHGALLRHQIAYTVWKKQQGKW
jgi:predicted HAD superfamily phosphohydrolase